MELKPTHEKPLGKAGKVIDKEFNPHLTEVDAVLNEKEQSFKKKVWDLSKMESLVFSDPKLNAKYDDMSEDGQEKYGYHYNETIMNMLFNEYVTNDTGYRQKYLNAIPEKKERRDKSGIHQLQQKGEKKMQQNSAAPKARTEGDVPIHNNSLEGVIEEDGMGNNLNTDGGGTFDDREYLNHRINKKYDTTPNTMDNNVEETTGAASSGAFSTALGAKNNVYEDGKGSSFAHVAGMHKDYSNSEKSVGQANKDAMNDTNPLSMDDIGDYDRKNREYDTMSIDTPDSYQENPYESVNKGKILESKESDEKRSKLYNDALKKFGFNVTYDSELSDEQRNKVSNYIKSNMPDSNSKTIGQMSENEECDECDEQIDETTTSSSSGAYVGPFHKKGRNHVTNKPAWKGGEIIGENYLTDTKFFKRIYNDLKLNEGFDSPNNDSRVPMAEYDMTSDKESMQHNLKQAYQQMSTLMKKSDPASKQAYENIKKTAQNISAKLGKPFKEPSKGGFMSSLKRGLGIGEGELHEHHLESREEKIEYILKMGKNKFGDAKMLNHQDDETIDRIYQSVEQNQTAINPMGEGEIQEDWADGDSTHYQEKMNSDDDYNYEEDAESQKDNELDWFIIVKGNDTNITREDKLEDFKRQGWGISDGPMDVHSANTELDDIMRMQSGGRTTARNFGWNEFDMGEAELNKPELNAPDLNEKAVSKSQQQFMGMVHAYKNGDMPDASDAIKKAAGSMSDEDAEDFASTKHKGLPDKVPTNEATDGWEGIVQYDSEKTDEEPFELGNGTKWQEVWAIYPNGTRDIGYYRFGHDLTYSWDYFNKTILGQKEINPIVGEGEVNEAGGRKYISYREATELANILDNTPVEQEEKIIADFAKDKELALPEFRYHIQDIIKSRLEGSDSPEYFKMENLITIVNDMIDQGNDQTADMVNRVKQDREQEAKLRNAPETKKSKMQKAGEDVWADFDPMTFSMGEADNFEGGGEDIAYGIAQLLQKIYPEQYDNIEDFKKFADLTVKTFFGGNYNKAFSVIKQKMSDLISKNEGMISGTEGSIIGDNPTSMVNISGMKDVQGSSPDMPDGMFEDDGHSLKSNGRKDDVKFDNNNSLDDFGTSHGGLTGFNKRSDGYYPEYKKPEAMGAPQNKDLGKFDSMTVTEGKEEVCENCGSQLDEEGQCRRDEKPVAGVLAGEKGACEKKNKKSKTAKSIDNKFNVKFRHKQEKERENKIEKKHSDYKKELDQNKKHMKKLKEMVEGTTTIEEAAQHPSMTNLNRLKKDNTKNFKADVKNSNSAEIAADQDELTAGEQIEEVPENAYELAEKIEKEKMKEHKFNSFDNDGNSTNDTNKDIPKRNATDDEADDIMLNRGLGMQDIVYDNKPDERFEERMKKDMGDQIYDQRQEKMKFRADAPMYNKDTQPVEEDSVEKTQFEKNISKFNDPKGVKENHIVAGKFVNDMDNTQLVNFNVNEAEETKEPKGTKLVLEGMGNTYTQGVNENAEMRNMMDSWDFYINAGKVTKVAKGKQTLTEGEEKKPINEQLEKMKKLWNYKPEGHLSTSNVKKNRGF